MDAKGVDIVAIIYAIGETLLSLAIVGFGFYIASSPTANTAAIGLASSAVMAVVVSWFSRRQHTDTSDSTRSLVSTIAASVTGGNQPPVNPTN